MRFPCSQRGGHRGDDAQGMTGRGAQPIVQHQDAPKHASPNRIQYPSRKLLRFPDRFWSGTPRRALALAGAPFVACHRESDRPMCVTMSSLTFTCRLNPRRSLHLRCHRRWRYYRHRFVDIASNPALAHFVHVDRRAKADPSSCATDTVGTSAGRPSWTGLLRDAQRLGQRASAGLQRRRTAR